MTILQSWHFLIFPAIASYVVYLHKTNKQNFCHTENRYIQDNIFVQNLVNFCLKVGSVKMNLSKSIKGKLNKALRLYFFLSNEKDLNHKTKYIMSLIYAENTKTKNTLLASSCCRQIINYILLPKFSCVTTVTSFFFSFLQDGYIITLPLVYLSTEQIIDYIKK